jgi:hypothetical protein
VLGAVQVQRPAAHEPGDQTDAHDGSHDQRRTAGQEHECDRGQEHREQHEALDVARDPVAAEQGRDRQSEARQASKQRYSPGERRRPRHLAFEQRSVAPRKREEPFARDHDPVRTGHAPERR